MSKESLLKKEFKQSDVERARNLVKKDFTSKTKDQIGYQKKYVHRSEGDIWEENGKTWTIKNGIRQNITKLDAAKKAVRVPFKCPKCGGPLKHPLSKKMYKIHGFCFDPCTVEFEHELKEAGLYEQYEKRMMQGSMSAFRKDIEQWAMEFVNEESTFVTEQGDVENWKSNNSQFKERILSNLKSYLTELDKHIT